MATLGETMNEWGCRTIFQDSDIALFVDDESGWWDCGRVNDPYADCVTTRYSEEAVSHYMAMLAEQLSEEQNVS
jgi:hypothetical protein